MLAHSTVFRYVTSQIDFHVPKRVFASTFTWTDVFPLIDIEMRRISQEISNSFAIAMFHISFLNVSTCASSAEVIRSCFSDTYYTKTIGSTQWLFGNVLYLRICFISNNVPRNVPFVKNGSIVKPHKN